jgi:hypothetical protein
MSYSSWASQSRSYRLLDLSRLWSTLARATHALVVFSLAVPSLVPLGGIGAQLEETATPSATTSAAATVEETSTPTPQTATETDTPNPSATAILPPAESETPTSSEPVTETPDTPALPSVTPSETPTETPAATLTETLVPTPALTGSSPVVGIHSTCARDRQAG